MVKSATVIFLLSLSVPVSGQTARESESQPSGYGTSDTIVYTLQAFAFDPATQETDFTAVNSYWSRYCLGEAQWCQFVAPVQIPDGSRLVVFELDACDFSSDHSVTACFLARQANRFTCVSSDSGCKSTRWPFPVEVIIDNKNDTYIVYITIRRGSSTIEPARFQAVRLEYRLQVSNPSATPTFADVAPTHPFFRFIEALAAAGVSVGCGDGNFCPGAPVTRGQMAVFLSAALGLHWAP